MKQIDDIILSIINDINLQKKLLNGEDFGVFDIQLFKNNNPYLVSEKVFIALIEFAKKNKNNSDIFEEIDPFITFSHNITDEVFEKLLIFAKNKNEWIYLSLCHAGLSGDKLTKLKELNLNESLWY